MGFLGFGNYDKAGPGIPKNMEKKKPFGLFFEIYFRKFWKLAMLNMLYVVCCIPIVTIGPATSAFVKILKSFTQEKHSFVMSDFFDAFKKNFKVSLIVGLADILIAVCLVLCFFYYPNMADTNMWFLVPYAVTVFVTITLIIMHFFIYLMISTTNLPLKNIIKNSFILAFVGLKKNALTFLGLVAAVAVQVILILIHPLCVLLIPTMFFSLAWFIICFNSYPIIEKYVINPFYEERGEENPDYAYLKPYEPEEGEDTVFADKGGTELPVLGKKGDSGKKGKVIS